MTDEQLEKRRQELLAAQDIVDFFVRFLLKHVTPFFFWTIPVQIFLGLVFALCTYWMLSAFALGGAWLTTFGVYWFIWCVPDMIQRSLDKQWDDFEKECDIVNGVRGGSDSSGSSGINMYT